MFSGLIQELLRGRRPDRPHLARALLVLLLLGAVTVPVALARSGNGSQGSLDYPTVAMRSNPVAYWRLGEPVGATTAVDSSGNGLSGTYSSVTLGVTGALWSESDTAAAFSGDSTSSLSVPDSPALNFGVSSFSADAWVRTEATSGTIIGKATTFVSTCTSPPVGSPRRA
jgi:hypothetical protein